MQGANAVKLNERPVKVGRVAEITGYSAGYIYQLVSAGKIPFHKHGGAGTKGAVDSTKVKSPTGLRTDGAFLRRRTTSVPRQRKSWEKKHDSCN